MSQTAGRSIRSGDRGREVLDAAAIVFARQGYAETSLDDIADELGATKGLIYHHYRSKESLLLDVLTAGAAALTEAVEPHAAASDDEAQVRLSAMAAAHVRITMTDYAYQRTAFRSLPQHIYLAERSADTRWDGLRKLRTDYEALFESVIAEIAPAAADAKLLTRAVLGTLNWVNVWYRPERDHNIEETAHSLASYAVAGVSANT